MNVYTRHNINLQMKMCNLVCAAAVPAGSACLVKGVIKSNQTFASENQNLKIL